MSLKRTTLITGATGFVGWHIARKLVERAVVRLAAVVTDQIVERRLERSANGRVRRCGDEARS